jgi:hypothetical protein
LLLLLSLLSLLLLGTPCCGCVMCSIIVKRLDITTHSLLVIVVSLLILFAVITVCPTG